MWPVVALLRSRLLRDGLQHVDSHLPRCIFGGVGVYAREDLAVRTLLGLSGFFVAAPLLIAWAKVRYWDWLNARNAR